MPDWQERRILITGMTYPQYSSKYTETVCTGGLFEDTSEMIRLYPIPRRYMGEEQRFKNFQFIRAEVDLQPTDPRPESYRIKPDSIVVEEEIPSTNPDRRRHFLDNSPHLCRSVEELLELQKTTGQSIGIIRPASITNVFLRSRPTTEREEWKRGEAERQRQQVLFEQESIKPLDFPEMRFMVQWVCDDPTCTGHTMGLEQWGLHELWRNLTARHDPDREEKLIDAMRRRLDLSTRDVYMFLGSFRATQWNFGLMDTYEPPKRTQGSLF